MEQRPQKNPEALQQMEITRTPLLSPRPHPQIVPTILHRNSSIPNRNNRSSSNLFSNSNSNNSNNKRKGTILQVPKLRTPSRVKQQQRNRRQPAVAVVTPAVQIQQRQVERRKNRRKMPKLPERIKRTQRKLRKQHHPRLPRQQRRILLAPRHR